MADKNKVTIDAAWFAELYVKEKQSMCDCKSCKVFYSVDEFDRLRKERDELKAKLEESQKHYCTSATGKLGDACEVAALCGEIEERLAAADRCIDNIASAVAAEQDIDEIERIIRAYREQKESGR